MMETNGWSRREFVTVILGTIAGITSLGKGQAGEGAQAVPWSAGTELPRLKVPQNAVDCHHHIYDSRFPVAPEATLLPADATVAHYRLLQKRLGTTRHVIVQPSTYGADNSCLLNALGQFGLETARGVAVVNTSVTDRELKDLHAAGVRGIRFTLSPPGTTTFQMVVPLAKQVEPLGWHIQVNTVADQIAANEELWNRVPSQIVFDHLAHVPQPTGIQHPVFAVVSNLLQKGKAWVKLSGAYFESKVGSPTYSDTNPVAGAYLKTAPERLVWGSDWPHPTEKVKPDDAILLDLLAEWVPDAAIRNRILVDNPAKLYGF
jgi:predicted TIM-barrel fold metal-dependent hydrolase